MPFYDYLEQLLAQIRSPFCVLVFKRFKFFYCKGGYYLIKVSPSNSCECMRDILPEFLSIPNQRVVFCLFFHPSWQILPEILFSIKIVRFPTIVGNFTSLVV